jgi:hypothetical protein
MLVLLKQFRRRTRLFGGGDPGKNFPQQRFPQTFAETDKENI